MLIDVHNHIGTSVDGPSATLDELLHAMEEGGVTQSVVFPIDEKHEGGTYQNLNDRVAEAQQKYPDRIVGFGRVVPTHAGAMKEMERCKSMGLHGIKLHPISDHFWPQDAEEVLETLNAWKWPVVLHTDHKKTAKPVLWKRHFEKFTNIRFILTHGGKDFFREVSELAERLDNVYVDTSTQSVNRTRFTLQVAGPKKILFASDFPYSHPLVELKKFEIIVKDEETRRLIFFRNAGRILRGA